MYETFITDRKKKPPLSIIRIIGEILAGFALGSISLICVIYISYWISDWIFGSSENPLEIIFFPIFITGSSMWFGIGCAAGIYLIGSIGKQTGSFSISLIGGFFTGLLALFLSLFLSNALTVMDDFVPLLLLIVPPIPATICFNLTRRYKKLKPSIQN